MIARYSRLLSIFASVETQYELEYRVNLAFNVLQQLVVTGTSLGAVFILFAYTSSMNGWSVGEMLLLIGTYYIVQNGALSAVQVVSFVVALTCGLALVYCLLLSLATLAFWFVRVENLLVIYGAFVDAARFPVDIYPGWLRLTLSSVAPIGIAVTVPAEALAGKLDVVGLGAIVVATILAWIFTRWFWRFGLRSYTGASA